MSAVYKGFSSIGVNGSNTEIFDRELIKIDLLNAFLIKPGEVPGWPSVGSIISNAMAMPFDSITKDAITEEAVRVCSGDPRVMLRRVEVSETPDGHGITIGLLLEYTEIEEEDFLSFTLTTT